MGNDSQTSSITKTNLAGIERNAMTSITIG